MNDVTNTKSPGFTSAQAPGEGRRPYQSPSLILFGQVAALTRSTGCTALADNGDSCVAGGMGGYEAVMSMSDRRLKQHIVRIGDHPKGFGLYLFQYKSAYRDQYGHGRQFGVMADEIEKVMPEAVTVGHDGYKAVYYGLLGIHSRLH